MTDTRLATKGARATVRTLGPAADRLELRAGDTPFYALALALVTSGLAHGVVQLVLGGPWDGPVSWRKPTTFGLSFGITLATIVWVSGFVPMPDRRRARLLSVFAFASLLEVVVITVQAWRRVPSHFNISTPLDAGFAYSAAFGGALLIVTSITLSAAAFRPGPEVSPSMRLALRVGFGTFLATLAIGAAMIAVGTVAARTQSQEAAYTAANTLKWGHAVTMHGVLVLPALAWLLGLTDRSEQQRHRVVTAVSAAYVLAAGAVVLATVVATVSA